MECAAGDFCCMIGIRLVGYGVAEISAGDNSGETWAAAEINAAVFEGAAGNFTIV